MWLQVSQSKLSSVPGSLCDSEQIYWQRGSCKSNVPEPGLPRLPQPWHAGKAPLLYSCALVLAGQTGKDALYALFPAEMTYLCYGNCPYRVFVQWWSSDFRIADTIDRDQDPVKLQKGSYPLWAQLGAIKVSAMNIIVPCDDAQCYPDCILLQQVSLLYYTCAY